MDVAQGSLQLTRKISIKSVVTPQWKEQAQEELQDQVSRLDRQMQSLETQGQQAIAQIQKQSIQPPSTEVQRQLDSVQSQVTEQKNKLLNQKNQLLQQLNQVQGLELDQEVNQGQMDSVFTLNKGDNLLEKMQVEVLLRDGVVEEIRGDV